MKQLAEILKKAKEEGASEEQIFATAMMYVIQKTRQRQDLKSEDDQNDTRKGGKNDNSC